MIVYDLVCAGGHRFESWFASVAAFERQAAEHSLECPLCGSDEIVRAPMAPRIGRGAEALAGRKAEADDGSEPAAQNAPAPAAGASLPVPAEFAAVLHAMRRHIEASCQYVGPAFAEQARRMHYGETEHRDIYGETTAEEADALLDEGIEVRRIPWLARRDD